MRDGWNGMGRSASWERGRDLEEPLVERSSGSFHKLGAPRPGWVLMARGQLRRVALALTRGRLGLQLLTVAACLAWMTASSWAILVNKHIMVNLHWPYPCTIAWMGLATTTAASFAAMHALTLLAGLRGQAGSSTSPLPSPTASSSASFAATAFSRGRPTGHQPRLLRWPGLLPAGPAAARAGLVGISGRHYVSRVLPTGFFMALTFTTGNMGYLHLTVAFVQMLKAFCPVVTMLLLFAARLEAPSGRLGAAVGAIAAGVALASYGELNLSLVGLSAMLVSVVAESVRLVMTQHLLAAGGAPAVATAGGGAAAAAAAAGGAAGAAGSTSAASGGGALLHPLEGLFYISSACTAVLAAQAAVGEWPRLAASGGWGALREHPGAFAVAAGCGFAVNLLAIGVIKLASSLTLKVLGTVKDAALVSIGILFLHEHVSRLQLVGYGISMAGFLSYNVIKAQQARAAGDGDGGGLAGGGGAGGKGGGAQLLPLYAGGACGDSGSKER